MPTIPRSEASLPDLIRFAELQGLDVAPDASQPEVEALLEQAGLDADTIEVPDDAPKRGRPKKAQTAQKVSAEPIREGDLANLMMTVLIPEQEGHQPAVPVGCNGSVLYIERGKPSPIKYKYFRILTDATAWVYAPTEKGGVGPKRVVSRIPVQVLDADPKIAAFLAQRA